MADKSDAIGESHTKLILERYKDRENIAVHHIDNEVLLDRYLRKVMQPEEFTGKTILELGAGCSTYVPVFMQYGCKAYYANDIIPERLKAIRIDDPRYHEVPGDFRTIHVPEKVDIVFASLTMMLVMPMLDEFVAKISDSLKPGGHFVSMDANYFCPYSVYRRYADPRANPVRLFSPFAYADKFRKAGFEVERLVPFTAKFPWTTGNWAAGTTFWMKASKK